MKDGNTSLFALKIYLKAILMLKKPMTAKELFDKIKGILKEKNKLPEILDYGLGAYHPVPIRTYEFDLKSNLAYGGSIKAEG